MDVGLSSKKSKLFTGKCKLMVVGSLYVAKMRQHHSTWSFKAK